jgi:hypothetical protein
VLNTFWALATEQNITNTKLISDFIAIILKSNILKNQWLSIAFFIYEV